MAKNEANSALKIIPLGGLHEIGKNTCVFEYDDEIILLDAGLAFPTEAMHGVNIVLPDMTYLRENRHKIKGMIVTHGHEDHIGGIGSLPTVMKTISAGLHFTSNNLTYL